MLTIRVKRLLIIRYSTKVLLRNTYDDQWPLLTSSHYFHDQWPKRMKHYYCYDQWPKQMMYQLTLAKSSLRSTTANK